MKKSGAALVLVLVLLPTPPSFAAFNSGSRGTTTANFLKLGVGARAVGMGEAYAAAADDASALYWNPAGLTRIQSRTVTLMHASYIDSSAFDYGAYAQRLGLGALGLGIQRFSAGSIQGTDAAGADIGTFTPSDLAVSVGYARNWKGYSFGLGVKYVQSKILKTARTEALDLGILSPGYRDGRLRLALAVANLGGRMKFNEASEDLPLIIRLGSAYRISERWLAALDVDLPKDNQPGPAFGLEYRLPVKDGITLAGRAGYNGRTAGDVSGSSGISLGLGFGFRQFDVDYAIVPYGSLGSAHRFSVSYRFGAE